MINFRDCKNENKTEHNSRYSRSSIQNSNNRRFWIRKNKYIINSINNQPNIDKICSYAKDPYEAKYQYLINEREKVGLKHYDDPKPFNEYSNETQDVYENIEEYNVGQKRKVLIAFDDMIADMINKKKLNPIEVRISTKRSQTKYYPYFYYENVKEERFLANCIKSLNHSSDIDFKDFMKIYKKCIAETCSSLVNDTALPSDNLSKFRKNLVE